MTIDPGAVAPTLDHFPDVIGRAEATGIEPDSLTLVVPPAVWHANGGETDINGQHVPRLPPRP